MLQNATSPRKSAPWPPNSSDEHVSCTAPATENASLQILFKYPTPAIVFGNATKPSRFAHFWQGTESLAPATQNHIWTFKSGPGMCFFLTFWLWNVLRATTACAFSTSQLPKVVQTWGALYMLTLKCASHHNSVHFFDISTSKSGPELVCFVHFGFEMCFAPQRRAIGHLNFQKWSEHVVFYTFWLGNVLRATTACNFSSLIRPHRSTPAALASLLFDPPEPQIMRKTQCFATFLPFRTPGSSFFGGFLFLIFFLLLFSDSSVHIVGSFYF